MKFSKYHGLGNDFLIVSDLEDRYSGLDKAAAARFLCDRHTGPGADGLMFLRRSEIADFRMQLFNSDGSEAEMCGNGIRCLAEHIYRTAANTSMDVRVETLAGIMLVRSSDSGGAFLTSVDMGLPVFAADRIPAVGLGSPVVDAPLEVGGRSFRVSTVLVGVPHTIVFQADTSDRTVADLGPRIENSPHFPRRTNVNFVSIEDRRTIAVRTWERGAGLTLACGTGACASVVVAREAGLVDREVRVKLLLGSLRIEYDSGSPIIMTGPSAKVCDMDCGILG